MTKNINLDAKPGLWILAVLIYFTLFIATIFAASNIGSESDEGEMNLLGGDRSTAQLAILNDESLCLNPRTIYDEATREPINVLQPGDVAALGPVDRLLFKHLDCEQSRGVQAEQYCNEISGCTWQNESVWDWSSFSFITTQSCAGDINAATYGIDTDTIWGDDVVAYHNNSGVDGLIASLNSEYTLSLDIPGELFIGDDLVSICNHPNVIFNKTSCEIFSCYWGKADDLIAQEEVQVTTNVNYLGDMFDTIGELFTFSYDFGNDNSSINGLLNFIFVGIPLFVLVVAIALIIRGN